VQHKILLIDDQQEAYDLVMDVVTRLLPLPEGHTVEITWADTVDDGHALIEQEGWSLIICDICFSQQPGIVPDPASATAGIELVRHANEKRGGKGNQPPIIVLTQYSTEQDIEEAARQAGTDEFLGKRILRKSLVGHIRKALGLPAGTPPRNGYACAVRWLRRQLGPPGTFAPLNRGQVVCPDTLPGDPCC
jgi:CheY-like chemotaxis protein